MALQRESFQGLFSQLCNFLYNTLNSLLCIILIVGFVLWLNTPQVKVFVNDASFTNFTLKNNTNDTFLIQYDMSLNIAVTNPNPFTDIYCDDTEASAFVHGQYQLTKVVLTPFYLRPKTTATSRIIFHGSQMLSFGLNRERFLGRFGAEERDGIYNIVVGFSISVRTKHGKLRINIPYGQPYIYCDLRVPLHSMDGKANAFEATKCDMGDGEEVAWMGSVYNSLTGLVRWFRRAKLSKFQKTFMLLVGCFGSYGMAGIKSCGMEIIFRRLCYCPGLRTLFETE